MSVTEAPTTSRKDWASDQEVRWCPGCGDYSKRDEINKNNE
jgi:2-oxoglutarate ferredoxin oxidoreductase subunit beta